MKILCPENIITFGKRGQKKKPEIFFISDRRNIYSNFYFRTLQSKYFPASVYYLQSEFIRRFSETFAFSSASRYIQYFALI